MSVKDRLLRLESLFESLYRSDQLKLIELRARKCELAERQEAILKALSSHNPCLMGLMGELLSNSVRLAADLEKIDGDIAATAKDAAPRKAQLERVRRKIAGQTIAEVREMEKASVDEVSIRPVQD